MHGDLIRRIEQTKDLIGHIHTAGVPGRGELDDKQEINYPAVMQEAGGHRVHRVRRAGVHPDPRPARRAEAGGRSCATCEIGFHWNCRLAALWATPIVVFASNPRRRRVPAILLSCRNWRIRRCHTMFRLIERGDAATLAVRNRSNHCFDRQLRRE